jgi:hypothetical protein
MFQKMAFAALVFSGLTAWSQPASPQVMEMGPMVPLLIQDLNGESARIEVRSFDGTLLQHLEIVQQEEVTLNIAPIHGYFVVRIEDANGWRTLKYHRP